MTRQTKVTNSGARTDVHAPKNLVTEDYQYIGAFDNQSAWAMSDWARDISRKLNSDQPERGSGQCAHCGAHLRYFAVLAYIPSGEYLAVGETCLDNRFSRATGDFHRLREAAQLDRQAQRIKHAVAAFATANPDLAWLATGELPEVIAWNNFVQDISRKLRQYGELSERQVAAVRAALVRAQESAARKVAEAQVQAAQPTADVPTGRLVVTGEVLTTKVQDGYYGSTLKMLVRDDRGFKVWGTVPSGLPSGLRGRRVTFTATLEASKDDSAFGFFSRPTSAKVLAQDVLGDSLAA